MLRSSTRQRAKHARRWKRAAAAALCAASFIGGSLLFGEEAPVRRKLPTKSIQPTSAPATAPSQSAAPVVSAKTMSNAPLPLHKSSLGTPGARPAEPAHLAPIVAAKKMGEVAKRPVVKTEEPKKIAKVVNPLPRVSIYSGPAEVSLSLFERAATPAIVADAQLVARTVPLNESTAEAPPPREIEPPLAPVAAAPTALRERALASAPQALPSMPPSAAPMIREQAAAPAPEAPLVEVVEERAAPATPVPFVKLAARQTQPVEDEAPAQRPRIQLTQAAQPPARPAPAAQPAPLPDPDRDADLKAHFEIIQQSGEFSVQVHRSKLLRTKKDIYRTAVVDDAVLEIVQFTPREVSLIGRAQGSTHVTFWFDDPAMQPVTYLVKVEPDAAEVKKDEEKYQLLEDMINEMFPDSKIRLSIIANKLVVKGQARDSEEAFQIMTLIRAQGGGMGGGGGVGGGGGIGGGFGGGFGFGGINEGQAADPLMDSATGSVRRSNYQVINMLRVPGVQQVALRVKIAELNRTAARNFGLNLTGRVDATRSTTGSKVFLNSVLAASQGNAPALLAQFDGDDIQIGLNTLQQHGVVKLLSEPTLVTLSGNPATFIAGGEFAVPTIVGSAGLNAVTTDFRAFGAIISFLPTVVDKDRIRLQVAPEFSQINSGLTVNGTPGLKVRAATTTVEMREGQTLAIAGLLEDNINANSAGDIPFLAKLIGKRGVTRAETELIILVTPELVHPMEAEEVPPLPGFDVTEPTNTNFFLHGDIEGNPTMDYRSTVWPRLKKRYKAGGPAMTSGPFGHGQ